MWIKGSPLLLAQIRLRGARPRLWFMLAAALYVPKNLLLAWEGIFALIPGEHGKWLRNALATIIHTLTALLKSPPQAIVDMDITDGRRQIRAKVRTWGLGGDKQ